jgi:maltokinase
VTVESVDSEAGGPPPGAASAAEPIYGADALTHLLRYQRVPSVERFNLVRHMPTPEASGERPVDDDGHVVVVGERVVVSWAGTVRDMPYTAPVTLAQLTAVDFLGVPGTHGLLIWTTPSGHEAPVAVVSRYLPRSIDGRQALIALLRRGLDGEAAGEGLGLCARMGRIAAALHIALATRSSVLADPVRTASAAELTDWHERIRATIDRAAQLAADGNVPGSYDFLIRLGTLEADADALLAASDVGPEVMVQRVHGDLHAGRILRWAGGLSITGFGDEPSADAASLGAQPAARDLARLLHSLADIAHQVDRTNPVDKGGKSGTGGNSDIGGNSEIGGNGDSCTREWLPGARRRLLSSYRADLEVARRPSLLDPRLIAAFEAEYTARELIESAHKQAVAESIDVTRTLEAFETGRSATWEQSRDPQW